jgi:copper chaperone CopZ
MKTTVYVPDIECDSCVKVLSRVFHKHDAIRKFSIKDDAVDFEYDTELISPTDIVGLIVNKNFRASLNPFERKSFSERWRHFKENRHHYAMELNVLSYALAIFLLLLGLEGVAYAVFLKNIPNFMATFGWWILYLNISVATIAMGIWHAFSYRVRVTCMIGMMIGMTIGMQSGFMIGAVIGATNGFFIGSMVGMLFGTLVGAWTGKCCGVMGIMEGMMAGLMGGTMGPMITVMMFSDHVLWFMPFYMAINVIIIWGMSYMLYEEVAEGNKKLVRRPADFGSIAALAVIVNFAFLGIMLFAPKSALLGI